MKKGIYIQYKNGITDIFQEQDIDCHELTIKGHASKMVDSWKSKDGIYVIDHYNAVLLDEVTSIRVIS